MINTQLDKEHMKALCPLIQVLSVTYSWAKTLCSLVNVVCARQRSDKLKKKKWILGINQIWIWCGHQGSHQIISHFSLVDLLWFDYDFVFYSDFLFYGIVSSLIWLFPFWCISEVFLNKTPGKVTALDFEIRNILRNIILPLGGDSRHP